MSCEITEFMTCTVIYLGDHLMKRHTTNRTFLCKVHIVSGDRLHWSELLLHNMYYISFVIGKPCQNLTINNSNIIKYSGVFQNSVLVQCLAGYVLPPSNDINTNTTVCQANRIWSFEKHCTGM